MSETLFAAVPAPAAEREAALRADGGGDRWRPRRAGICNIWEYDDQVFEFAEGRLVLRGANGSGKSNALALLVPFILEGVLAASRMDSMGGGRSMRTLLLCLSDDEASPRFRHDQRTGYVWLEFERGDEHVTIGCGARASVQRDAEAWFFLTERRPGIDLDLAPSAMPLAKGQLIDELGPAGVFESAEAYRESVDRRLLGIGRHRYANLLELLVVLRRPHLAGRLDLDRLSKALSDGLAPLEPALVADVAASYEDLEAVQADLRRMKDAQRTVDAFLPVYGEYLQAAGKERAAAAVEADRAVRAAERRLLESETAREGARLDLDRLCEERLAVARAREEAEQRQRAILESPAFRDASSLAEVEARATEAAEEAARGAHRLRVADENLGESEQRVAETARRVEAEERDVTRVRAGARSLAADAGMSGIAWGDDCGVTEDDLQRDLRAVAAARREEVAEVRRALGASEDAARVAADRLEAADRTEQAALSAEQRCEEGRDELEAARDDLRTRVDTLVRALGFPEAAALGEAVALLGDPGSLSLAAAVGILLRPRREKCAREEGRLGDQLDRLGSLRSAAEEECERIITEVVPGPDRLPSRPADRTGRRGVPLYAACDFRETVAAADRAGLEAALEAAGLLDAWIGPRSDADDAWLEPGVPVAGPSLADVLASDLAPDAGVDAAAVEAVLASVSLSDAGVSVCPDGSFRLGPLVGRLRKGDSEHIGSSARERHRRRLLEAAEARLAELDAEVAELQVRRDEVAAERSEMDRLEAELPPQSFLDEAMRSLSDATARARTLREQAGAAAERANVARHEADERRGALGQVAARLRLPVDRGELETVSEKVRTFERAASELVLVTRALTVLLRTLTGAKEDLERCVRARESALAEQAEADRRAAGLRARSDELRSRLGTGAEAPLVEMVAVEEELRRLSAKTRALQDEIDRAHTAVGAAEAAMEGVTTALESAHALASEAARRLDVLRRPDVWKAVVGEAADEAPAEVGELADVVAAATQQVAWEPDENRLQRGFRTLIDDIGRGYDPSLSYVDHLAIVEVTSEAGMFSLLWLAGELGAQVRRQETLLSERDREIFERHLLSRISEALRELLNDGDRLVAGINRSLADRPTSSGLSVQLRWDLETSDAPLRSAVALLRRTPELLGPTERDELRAYFERSIAQRRAEDSAASYAAVLSDVLDYRRWFVFVPILRSARGGSQRLTRTLFRSLSGGEQAVVLHLPLFAAAAAHYDAAAPGCPRLIALDEAFAGIDEQMRGELMGLLVRFDLDLLLTGHELWGAYEQVPALMTYDLLRRPPLEGVSALPLRWDGLAMAGA